MQQSIVKFYCFVVQTLLNIFRALLCPSSGACQTAVAASGFRMNVEVDVFSAVVSLLQPSLTNRPRLRTRPPPHSYGNQRLQRQFDGLLMMGIIMPETCSAVSVRQSSKTLRLIVASGWVFYLSDWRCTEPQTLNSKRYLHIGFHKMQKVPWLSVTTIASQQHSLPLSYSYLVEYMTR